MRWAALVTRVACGSQKTSCENCLDREQTKQNAGATLARPAFRFFCSFRRSDGHLINFATCHSEAFCAVFEICWGSCCEPATARCMQMAIKRCPITPVTLTGCNMLLTIYCNMTLTFEPWPSKANQFVARLCEVLV